MLKLFLAALALLSMAVEAVAQPADLTAKYENPLYGISVDQGSRFDNYGARWFDFWRGGRGFAHVPQPTEAKNCLREDLHFCIYLAQFLFAAPKPSARPGTTWMVNGVVEFRLLAITTVRFRDRMIPIFLIKSETQLLEKEGWSPTLGSVFSYSFEWGVIGYAEVWGEEYWVNDDRSPVNLEYVSVLASTHGLGGRENCKIWRCGPMPDTASR